MNAIQSPYRPNRFQTPTISGGSNIVCYCCGNSGHRAKDPRCPAEGMSCNNCHKLGHFARVCRQSRSNSKPVILRFNNQNKTSGDKQSHEINKSSSGSRGNIRYVSDFPFPVPEESVSDDEYVFELGVTGRMPQATVKIGEFPVDFIVDSGATVNVLDNATFSKINANSQITLSSTNLKLFPYGSSTPLSIQGSFTSQISHRDKVTNAMFVVVKNENSGSLLGHKTATDLELFQEHANFHPIQNISDSSDGFVQTFATKYPQVFNGIGKLNDFQLQLHIDPSVPPVAQAPRRIPFHIRKAVQTKIDELEPLDIIEPVRGPTRWVSPLVPVPKADGDICVCVDMRQANSAIIREWHPIPTIEETLQELQGTTVFSKLDLQSSYHQIELHPDSRPITTFATKKGLYQYTQLMFSISGPEIYQHLLQQILQGCPGIQNISNDIIVFRKTRQEHDHNLDIVLQRLKDSGLTLNQDKFLFGVPNLTFFWSRIVSIRCQPRHQESRSHPRNEGTHQRCGSTQFPRTCHLLFTFYP